MAQRDYYEILGVDRNATPEQIKAAYRRMARKYHPDVSKDPDAAKKFKEATAAYEVLSDPQKRRAYDQFGHAAATGGFGGAGDPRVRTGSHRTGPFAAGGFPFNLDEIFSASPFSGMNLEEILSALGGRGRTATKRRKRTVRFPRDLEYPVTLDFMQAVKGCSVRVQIGDNRGQFQQVEVKIPPGVRDGSKVRVRGKGLDGGDLYIITHVREHPYFRREGDDIYLELPVTVTEAALGTKVTVPTVDGPATVKIPPGTSSGTKLRLRNKGAPNPKTKTRGHQYVLIRIVLPKEISQRGKELLAEFDKTDPIDPRKNLPW